MMNAGKHSGGYPKKYWTMLIATLSGFLFPLAFILIYIIQAESFINFKNILRIHLDKPELFMLYSLPVFGAYIVHIIYTRQKKNQSFFQKIISEKDEIINRNIQFINEIDRGNYSTHLIREGEQDVLGKSLLALKENLQAKERKVSLQKWISEGKNVISNISRLYNKPEELGDHILEHLVKYIDAIQGAIYLYNQEEDSLVSLSTYAYQRKKNMTRQFKVGFGLIGQCASEREYIYRTEIPDDYFTISSGLLGEKKPASLLIVPLITENTLQGVVEIAFLSQEITEETIELVEELGEIIARTIFNLKVKQEEMKHSTEQLEARVKDLENLQKRQDRLLEYAPEIITIYDKNLNNIYVSPSVSRILGYSPKEYMKGKDFDQLTPEVRERMKELFKKTLEDPSFTPAIQYNYIRKDGQQIALESKFRNMLADPSINGIILNTNDISERYRAGEEELS